MLLSTVVYVFLWYYNYNSVANGVYRGYNISMIIEDKLYAGAAFFFRKPLHMYHL